MLTPEHKLMVEIFRPRVTYDSKLHDVVNGITLHDALMIALDHVVNLNATRRPAFSSRCKEIIIRRFGFRPECPPETLEKVGQHFDVTRERIRQIEKAVFRAMRHPARSKTLKMFIKEVKYARKGDC